MKKKHGLLRNRGVVNWPTAGLPCIHQQLGVMTGVNHETENPGSVLQPGPPQQNLVGTDRNQDIIEVQGPIEMVQTVVGTFAGKLAWIPRRRMGHQYVSQRRGYEEEKEGKKKKCKPFNALISSIFCILDVWLTPWRILRLVSLFGIWEGAVDAGSL